MCKILLFLLLAAMLVALPSSAQAQPDTPQPPLPSAVLAEAKRAAAISGRVLTALPTKYERFTNLPKRPRWRLEWKLTETSEISEVSVWLDERTNRATNFNDWAAEWEREAPNRVNAPIKTTHAQISALCDALAAQLRLSSSDWHRPEPELVLHPARHGQTVGDTEAVWSVRKKKYFRNYAISGQDLSVSIDPYNGRIINWWLNDGNLPQFHVPENPILSEADARQHAIKAFAAWTAPVLRPTDVLVPSDSFSGSPGVARRFSAVWYTTDFGAPSARLYYLYWFTLPYIEYPKRDTYKDPDEWHGRTYVHNFVKIDAETGELWDANNALGMSEPPFYQPNKKALSPRRRLLNLLARNTEYDALTTLLQNGGMPLETAEPNAAMRRFTLNVPAETPAVQKIYLDRYYTREKIAEWTDGTDARTIPFAFDAGHRLLLWELEPDKWAGWKLTPAQTADLTKWLQERTKSAPALGTSKQGMKE